MSKPHCATNPEGTKTYMDSEFYLLAILAIPLLSFMLCLNLFVGKSNSNRYYLPRQAAGPNLSCKLGFVSLQVRNELHLLLNLLEFLLGELVELAAS